MYVCFYIMDQLLAKCTRNTVLLKIKLCHGMVNSKKIHEWIFQCTEAVIWSVEYPVINFQTERKKERTRSKKILCEHASSVLKTLQQETKWNKKIMRVYINQKMKGKNSNAWKAGCVILDYRIKKTTQYTIFYIKVYTVAKELVFWNFGFRICRRGEIREIRILTELSLILEQ